MKQEIFAGTVKGRYKIEAVKADGSKRMVADWFDNLITNEGLNHLGTGGVYTYCMVGSGNTPPVNANTTLQASVSATNAVIAETQGAQSSAPYFGWHRKTFRFPIGAAAGNLSEIGVGWNATNVFSRALIVDTDNNPTTITVLSDEALDVTYEFRIYPPTADQVNTINISGVTYDVTTRAALVATSSHWYPAQLASTGYSSPDYRFRPYTGTIGAITEGPSGTTVNDDQNGEVTYDAYSNNSLTRTGKAEFGLTDGNLSGGIGSILAFVWSNGAAGSYQMSFSPKIPKDMFKILSLNFSFSWARHTG
jgi:hypothetical protein